MSRHHAATLACRGRRHSCSIRPPSGASTTGPRRAPPDSCSWSRCRFAHRSSVVATLSPVPRARCSDGWRQNWPARRYPAISPLVSLACVSGKPWSQTSRVATKLTLLGAVTVVLTGCGGAVPQDAPGMTSQGPRTSVDDRLVAAAQRLLPGYTYGALTDTADATCDAFQSGASWQQEL